MNSPNILENVDIIQLLKMNVGDRYCANVPLNKISFKIWDENKFKNNLKIIKDTHSVFPIMLGDYNDNENKYGLIDGIHRCSACQKIGYTHIPAIIPNYIYDNDFDIIHDRVWNCDSLKQLFGKYENDNDLDSFWKIYFDHYDKWSSNLNIIKYNIKNHKQLNNKLLKWYNDQINSNELSQYQEDELNYVTELINNVD